MSGQRQFFGALVPQANARPQCLDQARGAAIVTPSIRCERDAAGIATVWFDVPGRSVNAVSAAVLADLDAVVRGLEAAPPSGVIFASAKPGTFIVGGDLFEIRDAEESALDAFLALGQSILDRIAALDAPTVAAISGDALGGGYELALACRRRIAAAEPRIRIGLPETVIGIIPGWCGTLRLPRLVGLERGLDLLVTGRTVPPAAALELGMIDEVVPAADLLAAARRLAVDPTPRPAVVDSGAADARSCRVACDRARAATRARWDDHLPAPLRIVDVVEASYLEGVAAAATAERRTLIELRRGTAGSNLLRLFFLRSGAKKVAARRAGAAPRDATRVAVVGDAATGPGIAMALAGAGLDVDLVAAAEADGAAVARADLVIEAVEESVPAKRDAFRRLDGLMRTDAILAGSTGCLSITELAAATRHPERVIGLHFPVNATTPVVEVVAAERTAADAIATGVAVVARAGKTPIVVGDAPGFVVNRILFRGLRAAALLLDEGTDADVIDAAACRWGMVAGPLSLLDEIGLDTSQRTFETLSRRLDERFAVPPVVARAVSCGWLGRRSGRGLFMHPPSGEPSPNRELAPARRGDAADPHRIVARLVQAMAEEAGRVLAAGVVDSIDAVDLATVLGAGFPGFRGGLATSAGLGGAGPR